MRIIIRACRERQQWVDYLLSRLSDAEVVYDTTRNAMDTFFAALRAAGDDAVIHMEDDVILTKDFTAKAATVIAEHPDHAIQFFSRRSKDIEIGSRWEPGSSFLAGLCFYLPPGMSADLMRYDWPRRTEHPTGLDLMVADYLKANKQRYWLHVPSLVQHRICTSLIDPHRSRYRQSITFRDPDDDILIGREIP